MTYQNLTWKAFLWRALLMALCWSTAILVWLNRWHSPGGWQGSLAILLLSVLLIVAALMVIGHLGGVDRTLEIDRENRVLRVVSSQRRICWEIPFNQVRQIDAHRRAVRLLTSTGSWRTFGYCQDAVAAAQAAAEACGFHS